MSFVVNRRTTIALSYNLKLAAQNLSEKVTIAAGWLQESGVDTLALPLHHVEHGVDLASVREYLTVVDDALS